MYTKNDHFESRKTNKIAKKCTIDKTLFFHVGAQKPNSSFAKGSVEKLFVSNDTLGHVSSLDVATCLNQNIYQHN